MKLQWLFQSMLLSGVCCYAAEKMPLKVLPNEKKPVMRSISFTGKDAFDPEKARQDVLDLIEKGCAYLEKNSFIQFAQRINETNDFALGSLYLFVYDQKCTCLAHGRDSSMIWKNFSTKSDGFGTLYVKRMVEAAQKGGGWVTFEWYDATKVAYAKLVEKDGKKYVIGCGFYPNSKADAAVTLVRGAASTFYNYIDRGASEQDAFSDFSYLGGKFVYGDLYIYVFDKDLTIKANGRDPGEIGLSFLDVKDEQGNYLLRPVLSAFENSPKGRGHWFDYVFYNAPMRTYIEQVFDKKGNPFFIACGFHQYADREVAVELVQRGLGAVKERGLNRVAEILNDWASREFVYGRMALFIYDFEGNVIAEGGRPTIVGKNIIKDLDESGAPYIQDLINFAHKEDKLWFSYRLRRSTCSVYAETFEDKGKKYIIGTNFYPISKESAMLLLVKSAQGLLETVDATKAFGQLSKISGRYVLGDLTVFVYGLDGTCYADGLKPENVWRTMLQDLDEEGRPYVKIMINEGKVGPAKVIFKKNGAHMVAYVEPLKKDNKTYIVGSGYFL